MPTVRMTKNGQRINVASATIEEHEALGWSLVSQQSSIIRQAVVILNDEEIKALPTTAIEVVPAPGANKVIIPIAWMLDCDTTEEAYTLNSSNTLGIGPGSNTGDHASDNIYTSVDPDYVLTLGAHFIGPLGFPSRSGVGPAAELSAAENAGLYLKQNGTDNTDGDPANTLTVTVWYVIVDL